MTELKYIITDEQGIHARPAGFLVKLAGEYPCNITIGKEDRFVDAKRIMGIMSLGVKKGEEITIKADGEQEQEAINAIEKFLNDNLWLYEMFYLKVRLWYQKVGFKL